MVTYELTAKPQLSSLHELEPLSHLPQIWQQVKQELWDSTVYQQAIARLQNVAVATAEDVSHILTSIAQEAVQRALSAVAEQRIPSEPEPVRSEEHSPCEATVVVSADIRSDSVVDSELPPSDDNFQNWLETMGSVIEPHPSERQKLHERLRWQKPQTRHEVMAQKRQQWDAQVLDIVGQLRQAREAKGLSLEQLHRLTKITLHQLQILESGNLQEFPEEIYVRGFIRRIANSLGLDGISIARSLPSLDWHETHSVLPSWRPAAEEQRPALNSAHLYVAYAALMAGAVGGLAWTMQSSGTANPAAEMPPLPEPTMESVEPRQELGDLGTASLSSMQEVAPPEIMPF